MSAADVIAEALLAYWVDANGGRAARPPDGHSREMTTAVLAALSAARYVVATPEEIRAWPVEQQAELIGGEVHGRSEVESIVDNHLLSNGDLTTGLRLRRFVRVIGPEVEVRDV